MSGETSNSFLAKYRYEALFGAWLAVTGANFLRISRQPYSSRLKIEQYESIFKGTSLSALLVGSRGLGTPFPATFTCHGLDNSSTWTTATPVASNMLLRVGSLSVECKMWNPLYAIAPMVLLLVSIPLAMFAVVTTSMAVTLLSFRALVVYFQLGLALISAWLSPPSSKALLRLRTASTSSSKRSSPTRRRRSSNTSTASQDTVVPATPTSHLPKKSGSLSALIGTSEITRDFEGVGGWRVPGDSDEEALWMGLNKRLQLPADVPARRHKRSLTGGPVPSQRWTWSPEALRMSPVQSRARTPVRFAIGDEGGYFPAQPLSNIRPMSSSSDPLKHHRRRKSGSGSSASSTPSASGISMAIQEAGE